MVKLNKTGYSHARSLIEQGKVNKTSSWSFSADDGNKILGKDKDWSEYKKWFLGIDPDAPDDTKEHYKFPYGKNGKVYRSGVIAAKQRAAQYGYTDIENAADKLLQMIDKDETKKEAVEIEQKEKEVVFLVEPEAQFVSLVTRGANRVPFKVIKSDNKEKPMRVVQSIIAPADLSREDLLKIFGEDLKEVVKFDKATGTKFKNYEQIPRDAFDENSFELVKLTDDIMAVCGSLKDDSGFISKIFKKTKQEKGIEVPEEVKKLDDKEIALKISEIAYTELCSLYAAVEGVLTTPGIDSNDRIEMLKKTFDGFLGYIESLLSASPVSKLDFEEVKRLRESNKAESVTEENQETPDRKEPVADSTEKDSTKEQNKDDSIKEEAKKEYETLKSNLENIAEKVSELTESFKNEIKKLEEKVENLEASIPVTVSVNTDSDPSVSNKSESVVFKGVLFGRE